MKIYAEEGHTWIQVGMKWYEGGGNCHEIKAVKDTWTCHVCQFNTVKTNQMYKIITKKNWLLCCNDCIHYGWLKRSHLTKVERKVVKKIAQKYEKIGRD